ncbi:protein of unknown function [Azospirillum baldaniorum]|uniref:Uncharacterized protein n=1 Tax=Azospirillum baldaniorum TaxID=1064539 RepID=A0A9P1NL03_9PROT|nr:protein of unknown function [Azospirillum baldaniorum]
MRGSVRIYINLQYAHHEEVYFYYFW